MVALLLLQLSTTVAFHFYFIPFYPFSGHCLCLCQQHFNSEHPQLHSNYIEHLAVVMGKEGGNMTIPLNCIYSKFPILLFCPFSVLFFCVSLSHLLSQNFVQHYRVFAGAYKTVT